MTESTLAHRLLATARKIISFAAVSLVALAADFGLFLLLIHVGVRADLANFISAIATCAIVYFISTKHIFAYEGRFLLGLFLVYLVYQFALITIASWAVGYLVGLGLTGALAKALTLPVTFSSNYLVLQFMTRPRHRRPLERGGSP